MYKGRHRRARSATTRALTAAAAAAVASTGFVAFTAAPAAADISRCVGAVQTPGAFACYTSPRFNQSGFERTDVTDFPVVCYGAGCTGDVLYIYEPGGEVDGRFTSVFYLGHTYEIYRPADSQPYILTSDNPNLDPLTEAQVLALSTTLDTLNGIA